MCCAVLCCTIPSNSPPFYPSTHTHTHTHTAGIPPICYTPYYTGECGTTGGGGVCQGHIYVEKGADPANGLGFGSTKVECYEDGELVEVPFTDEIFSTLTQHTHTHKRESMRVLCILLALSSGVCAYCLCTFKLTQLTQRANHTHSTKHYTNTTHNTQHTTHNTQPKEYIHTHTQLHTQSVQSSQK